MGAFGTLATISASVIAGPLAEVDLRYPFWVGSVIALLVWRAIQSRSGDRHSVSR